MFLTSAGPNCCWSRRDRAEDIADQRSWDRLDVERDLVQVDDQAEQIKVQRPEDQVQHRAVRLRNQSVQSRPGLCGGIERRPRLQDGAVPHAGVQLSRSSHSLRAGGENAATREVAEQLPEDAAGLPRLELE